jgi:hypothetical protein
VRGFAAQPPYSPPTPAAALPPTPRAWQPTQVVHGPRRDGEAALTPARPAARAGRQGW